jgi:hypothetical protein
MEQQTNEPDPNDAADVTQKLMDRIGTARMNTYPRAPNGMPMLNFGEVLSGLEASDCMVAALIDELATHFGLNVANVKQRFEENLAALVNEYESQAIRAQLANTPVPLAIRRS